MADAALRPSPHRDGPDDWPTPECLQMALVRMLPLLPSGRIWEPAAGAGRLVAAMRAAGRKVIATDRPGLDYLTDARPTGPIAAIVTNPPFNRLDAFLARSLEHLDAGVTASVTLLLRWDHLTASGRSKVLNRATEVRLCAWRPRWIVDSTTGPRWSFAWVTWSRERTGTHLVIVNRD
jgi:hypothetical protein